MTDKQAEAIREKIVKLSTLKNIAHIIAKAKLDYGQRYFCILDGKRAEIIKG